MNRKDVGSLIRQIHTALEKDANKELSSNGVTVAQMDLLLALKGADEPLTFKEIEKRVGLAQSTTVGLISRLEKKSLVKTFCDKDDGRIKYAALTALGKRRSDEAEESIKKHEEKLLEDLNSAEREQLIGYLCKVAEALGK